MSHRFSMLQHHQTAILANAGMLFGPEAEDISPDIISQIQGIAAPGVLSTLVCVALPETRAAQPGTLQGRETCTVLGTLPVLLPHVRHDLPAFEICALLLPSARLRQQRSQR